MTADSTCDKDNKRTKYILEAAVFCQAKTSTVPTRLEMYLSHFCVSYIFSNICDFNVLWYLTAVFFNILDLMFIITVKIYHLKDCRCSQACIIACQK